MAINTATAPRDETHLDRILDMAKEIYQRLDAIGDQVNATADRMLGSETQNTTRAAGNGPVPQAVPNGKLDDLQARLRRALNQIEAIQHGSNRLDSAL